MGSLEFGVNNTIFGAFSKLGVFVMIGENIAFVLAKDPIAKALSRVAANFIPSLLLFVPLMFRYIIWLICTADV
ncbi:hypothetical protein V6N13_108035 [Hibiscus sabdariffa]